MNEISQTELLSAHSDSIQKQIHTALPARVVSFDSSTQTVQIELLIEQLSVNNEVLSMPPLVDVPVQMFSYGECYIVAAPAAGDEGLAVFSERCIDGWFSSGDKSIPMDIRFHDFSDAFFIGGFKSAPKALPVSSGSLTLANGSTSISINSGNVVISGNVTISGTINVSGQGVIDGIDISGHTHGNVQNGSGSTGTAQ